MSSLGGTRGANALDLACMCDQGSVDPFTLYRGWRADVLRYRPSGTGNLYVRTAVRILGDLGDRHPAEWTVPYLRSYLEEQSPANAKLCRQVLADLLGWMVERGYREDNPLEEIRPRRRTRNRIRRGLSQDELTRAVIAASWYPDNRPQWRAPRLRVAQMMLAQYYTGVRPGELCKMQTAHVHLDGRHPYIEVVETKTDSDRIVPLSAKAQAVFATLVHNRVGRVSNVSSRSYWDAVHRACEVAGLSEAKRRPYALRHTFATTLIEAGVDARRVADLLGHSDMRSIHIYTVPSDPSLRAAVELVP